LEDGGVAGDQATRAQARLTSEALWPVGERVRARVDLAAIERNCGRLRSLLREGPRCARWSRLTGTVTVRCRVRASR